MNFPLFPTIGTREFIRFSRYLLFIRVRYVRVAVYLCRSHINIFLHGFVRKISYIRNFPINITGCQREYEELYCTAWSEMIRISIIYCTLEQRNCQRSPPHVRRSKTQTTLPWNRNSHSHFMMTFGSWKFGGTYYLRTSKSFNSGYAFEQSMNIEVFR